MKASDILLSLENERLEVFRIKTRCETSIGVCYKNCEVKDGYFLKGEFGVGRTFEESCENYLNLIRGKTLIFEAYSDARHEVMVLG